MDNDKNSNIGIFGLLVFALFLAYLAWLLSRPRTTTVKELDGGWIINES